MSKHVSKGPASNIGSEAWEKAK